MFHRPVVSELTWRTLLHMGDMFENASRMSRCTGSRAKSDNTASAIDKLAACCSAKSTGTWMNASRREMRSGDASREKAGSITQKTRINKFDQFFESSVRAESRSCGRRADVRSLPAQMGPEVRTSMPRSWEERAQNSPRSCWTRLAFFFRVLVFLGLSRWVWCVVSSRMDSFQTLSLTAKRKNSKTSLVLVRGFSTRLSAKSPLIAGWSCCAVHSTHGGRSKTSADFLHARMQGQPNAAGTRHRVSRC